MKKTWMAMVALSTALAFTACDEKPKAEQAEVGDAIEKEDNNEMAGAAEVEATAYSLAADESKFEWRGYKRFTNDEHKGTLSISSGELMVEGDNIVGGKFEISMGDLVILDEGLPEEQKAKLAGHLQSDDFFNVEKFPVATFEIVEATPYTAPAEMETQEVSEGKEMWRTENPTHKITGNLTALGTTKSISFPARVEMNDGKVMASAKFGFNRDEFGIKYGVDADVRDQIISKDVNVAIDVVAMK